MHSGGLEAGGQFVHVKSVMFIRYTNGNVNWVLDAGVQISKKRLYLQK